MCYNFRAERNYFFSSEKLTVKALREYCRQFHLKLSGNKAALQAQLEAFSRDRDAWVRCVVF